MGNKTYGAAFYGCLTLAVMVHAGQVVVEPDGMTPNAALERIRAEKAKGNQEAWSVIVKPGIYALTETLTFTPADS
ncbi:MAG: hypothetical protein PHE10_06030, partial [Kiritimatiellae bacterium]|nr:hypothetical protein [Kiritimatiellia bacterium]